MNKSLPAIPLNELWSRVCDELQKIVSPDAVARWFLPLQVEGLTEGSGKKAPVLTLVATNTIYAFWIEENYLPQLRGVLAQLLGRKTVQVAFKTQPVAALPPQAGAHAPGAALPLAAAPTEASPVQGDFFPAPAQPTPSPSSLAAVGPSFDAPALTLTAPERSSVEATGLNPRNTFDAFVVGPDNQFAAVHARAVADAPARSFNPLFIHGRVGLGKTHLMQAIGNHLMKKKGPTHYKVKYVTSEQFTNDFISAIQQGDLSRFRKRYRQVDVLLIDDIQFLAGKDRSQEEFFHTFNALFDGSKQIVLTSDAPPSEIANLEKRLSSRFESGLTLEIQTPGIETRLAILRTKVEAMRVALPDEVLVYIAERIKTNVRRLEGALTRVAAYASLHSQSGLAIALPQVEALLKDLLQHESPATVSIDVIQRKVAETFDIRLADMTSKRRPASIANPRMIAMYLSRRLTSNSLAEIGEAFGGRDHGTVLHAQKTVEARMKADTKLGQQVEQLLNKLVG
ncbi:chromosomal replication initiator protein [Verrucomicrobium sp. GAS474]|uniref:chromosomal replication initiator protein DnaA n=1 Tax=Verrucomicrobium sp. GAS474 TaxID=1882831 RepID=UPI00087BCE4A|nr:chromosomal replication initiator protein DnaA [Verrucomicrobium sp. GAS474]SDT93624.1 chromosomal replication initiator protein [Verrucomicrobium sp. GAS474]